MALFSILALFAGIIFNGYSSYADETFNPLNGENGTYYCSYTVGGTTRPDMVTASLADTVAVQKISDQTFYMFVTQFQAQYFENMQVYIGDKRMGYVIADESIENKKTFAYTVSRNNLTSAFVVSAYINAMGTDVSFTISLNLDTQTYNSEYLYPDITEYPPQFVPVISVSGGYVENYSYTQGDSFSFPAAVAKIGDTECAVEYSAYYINNNVREEITLNNNSFALQRSGIYVAVFTAESSLYTTSLDNPSVSVLESYITASSDGSGQQGVTYKDDLTESVSTILIMPSADTPKSPLIQLRREIHTIR